MHIADLARSIIDYWLRGAALSLDLASSASCYKLSLNKYSSKCRPAEHHPVLTDVTRLNFFEVARAAKPLSSRNVSPKHEVRSSVCLYHVAIPTDVSLLSLSSRRRSRAAGLQGMSIVSPLIGELFHL